MPGSGEKLRWGLFYFGSIPPKAGCGEKCLYANLGVWSLVSLTSLSSLSPPPPHYPLPVPAQHPYPSEEQKKQLAQDTGLTILQVNNW